MHAWLSKCCGSCTAGIKHSGRLCALLGGLLLSPGCELCQANSCCASQSAQADEERSRERSREENKARARALWAQGNKAAAMECYQKAVDIQPVHAKQFVEVGAGGGERLAVRGPCTWSPPAHAVPADLLSSACRP